MKKEKSLFDNLILICLISMLFLLFFSTSTSPLYKDYQDDSAIFITVGKMLKDGKVLYKDIFDHKGPVFFFIEYIGQIIYSGRFGMFILQIISMTFSLFMLNKILSINTNKSALYSIILSLPLLAFFFEEGNLTEELSLPFITLGLYIGFIWYSSSERYTKKIYLYGFCLGILISLLAFIRLNNAIPLVGLVLGITILFIKDKKYKNLIVCIISFLIGLGITTLIVLIYFIKNSAMTEMIYATFIHNFMYFEKNASIINKLPGLIPIVVLLLVNIKNPKMNILHYITAILSIIMGLFSRGFLHYYIINYPISVIMLYLFLDNLKDNKDKFERYFIKFILALVLLTYLLLGIFMINKSFISNNALDNIISIIPENERDSFLVYDSSISGVLYLDGNIFPAYKYAFMQSYLFATNEDLIEKMNNDLKDNNIKWILTENPNLSKGNKVDQYINENYLLAGQDILFIKNGNDIREIPIYLYEKNNK